MKKLLLPLLLIVFGLAAGGGAGYLLRTPAADEPAAEKVAEDKQPDPSEVEFAKLGNQFIVPVLEGGRIVSLVAISLSLEVPVGKSDIVYAREPKIQDAFLQVLFDHANAGGFRGSFTDSTNLVPLRRALLEQARQVLGDVVNDVLITEIARQDS